MRASLSAREILLTDLAGLPIARPFQWGRWFTATILLLLLALLVRAFAQGQIE